MSLKCLICGQPATNDRRGLCGLHYSRFNAAKRKLPEDKRDEFEQELVEKKLLLPPKPKGRVVEEDVFSDIAARIVGKPIRKKTAGQRLADEVAEVVAEGLADAEKVKPKKKPPKRTGPQKKAGNQ